MANKLYEEADVQDIAVAIREKNGTSDTYTVSQMGNAIREITACDHNIKFYDGTITETVSGSRKYAVLAKDAVLAEHRNDDNLFVRVEFDLEPTAYAVKKSWGTNRVGVIPYNTEVVKQLMQRHGEDATINYGNSNYGVNDDTSMSGVGRIYITEDGELRIYSNSANYAIRPSNYTVRVEW